MNANYRKRIELVQATQLTKELIDAAVLDEAPLPAGVEIVGADYHQERREVRRAVVMVSTGGRRELANVGDWITTDKSGFVAHWPADIFERVFEPIPECFRVRAEA